MAPDPQPSNARGETKTSIDALVEILKSRGKMELNAVSTALGVDSNLVESWAKVLENGGLVKIDYEVGKMYLEPLGVSKESIPNIQSKMKAQEAAVEETISADRMSLDRFMSALDRLSGEVSGIEAEYRKRMPEIQQMFTELNKASSSVEATQKGIDEIKKNVESSYGSVSKKLEELSGKVNSFGSMNSEASIAQSVERLNALKQKAIEAQNAIGEIEKNKNKAFDTIMKSIDAEVKEIRRQITDANKDIENQLQANRKEMENTLKQIQDQHGEAKRLSDQLKAFRNEQDSYRKVLDRSSAEARDKFTKMNDQLQHDIHTIEESAKSMSQKLESTKAVFGGVANFDQTLNNSKAQLEALKKETMGVKTEIEELAGQLRAFKSMSNLTIEKSIDEINKMAKKTRDANAKVAGLKGKVAKAKSDIDEDSKRL